MSNDFSLSFFLPLIVRPFAPASPSVIMAQVQNVSFNMAKTSPPKKKVRASGASHKPGVVAARPKNRPRSIPSRQLRTIVNDFLHDEASASYEPDEVIVALVPKPESCTPELMAEICERVAAGEPVSSVVKEPHLPTWLTV